MSFFDIRAGCKWDLGRGIYHTGEVETNLIWVWMEEVGIPRETSLTELLGRYFVVADSSQIEHLRLKSSRMGTGGTYEDYVRKGRRYLKQIQSDLFGFGITTHQRWEDFLHEYQLADCKA